MLFIVMARMSDDAPVLDRAKVKQSLDQMPREGVWVAFRESEPHYTMRLGPSSVVVVCKRTGRVQFSGSTGDEG
jgi:hypothetical protein